MFNMVSFKILNSIGQLHACFKMLTSRLRKELGLGSHRFKIISSRHTLSHFMYSFVIATDGTLPRRESIVDMTTLLRTEVFFTSKRYPKTSPCVFHSQKNLCSSPFRTSADHATVAHQFDICQDGCNSALEKFAIFHVNSLRIHILLRISAIVHNPYPSVADLVAEAEDVRWRRARATFLEEQNRRAADAE